MCGVTLPCSTLSFPLFFVCFVSLPKRLTVSVVLVLRLYTLQTIGSKVTGNLRVTQSLFPGQRAPEYAQSTRSACRQASCNARQPKALLSALNGRTRTSPSKGSRLRNKSLCLKAAVHLIGNPRITPGSKAYSRIGSPTQSPQVIGKENGRIAILRWKSRRSYYGLCLTNPYQDLVSAL